jgi:methyl-accepting chemotaxis protein
MPSVRASAPERGRSAAKDGFIDAAWAHLVDFAAAGASIATAVVGLGVSGMLRGLSWPAGTLAIVVAAALSAMVLGVVRRRRDLSFAAAVEAIQRVAEGDLRGSFDSRSAGQAALVESATRDIVQHLRLLLTEADVGAELLRAGWRTMNEVAWVMTNTSEGTVNDVAAAASAATEVSENMQFIASATEETTATMREVAVHAADAAASGQVGVEQITSASDTVEELQSASKRVEDVLQLINTVARQTHLLALNATIEAARAGEHGRGFTVVASEVKQLAGKTADATGTVTATMREIETGSQGAVSSMRRVSETIVGMSSRQQSIAAAVEQQTSTTRAIAKSTADAADQALAVASSVKSLTHAVRLCAYAGAKARTAAADVAGIEQTIRTIVERFRFEPLELVADRLGDDGAAVAVSVNGVTVVQNNVTGAGLHEFNYAGMWGHATGNLEAAGTNSHSSMPGDTATLRFAGTRIRLYGVVAPNHGKATVSVDGHDPVTIDQYADQREQGKLDWQSPVLPRGEHTFTLTVLAESHPKSTYFWVNVDRVEIEP